MGGRGKTGVLIPFPELVEVETSPLDPDGTQYGIGEAFCIQCKHEWVAQARTGKTDLECPGCNTFKGLFKFEFVPSEDVWHCGCGNALFYHTTEGHMCANCGIYQRYD